MFLNPSKVSSRHAIRTTRSHYTDAVVANINIHKPVKARCTYLHRDRHSLELCDLISEVGMQHETPSDQTLNN